MPLPSQHLNVFCALITGLVTSVSISGWAANNDMLPRGGTLPDLVIPAVEWLPPREALKTLTIHEDFTIDLVANEPDIIAPVVITFDENGRMWVCEMQAYMPDVDGTGEGEPISRIVVLEDADRDGSYENKTVFLDGLSLPRAITRVKGGILLGEGGKLWFCADTDDDLVCDKRHELIDYAKNGKIEHMENALTWCIDNWYYSARSDRRFRFVDGRIEAESTGVSRAQWGLTTDNYGRRYANANGNLVEQIDALPPHYGARARGKDGINELYQKRVTNTVKSIRVNPGVNRAYEKKLLDERGHLKRVTSGSAPAIYRGGGGWPDSYIGHALTTAPCANTAPLIDLSLDGWHVKGTMVMGDTRPFGEHDFIASTDEPTKLMKDQGYGKGYKYSHDYPGNFAAQEFMPEEIAGMTLYDPGQNAREAEMRKRLKALWGEKYGY